MYIVFLITCITVQIVFGAIRLHSGIILLPIHGSLSVPASRFDESMDMFLNRLPILICYVLLLIGIGNHFFDRLLKNSKKLHNDLEEQVTNVLTKLASARDNSTGQHIVRTQTMIRVLANAIKKWVITKMS